MAPKRKRKCVCCNKMFLPKFDAGQTEQTVCSNKCCIKYYDTMIKGRKSKRVARRWAAQVGKRSMGEVRFEYNNFEKKKRRVKKFSYESDLFEYIVPEIKREYTPDWTITTNSGKTIYIEFKGVLDLDTRKKMKLVISQHPDKDIRFVFQRGINKIRKGSKTTYMAWAAKEGIRAADGEIPNSWLI